MQLNMNEEEIISMNLKLALTILFVTTLNSCASPTRVEQMTITAQEATKHRPATVLSNKILVNNVSGGENTNVFWTSEIGNTEFKKALEISLSTAKLLATGEEGKYSLNTKLLKVDQPKVGLDLTVTIAVQYKLVRLLDGKELFNETITSPYTATQSDSFLASDRLKLANEGAVRNNLTQLINSLYELNVSASVISLIK
jgi:hypothetical protein